MSIELLFAICVMTLSGIVATNLWIIKSLKQMKKDSEELKKYYQPIIKEKQLDPFIQDLVDYTFKKGILCSIRPGRSGRMFLFHAEEDKEFVISEVFTTTLARGSAGYKTLLKEITDKVDSFIENKKHIVEKMEKEKENATNK